MSILKKFIMLSVLVTTSLFSVNIGTITSVTGDAFISRDGSQLKAINDAKLNVKDTIITKEKSKVKIIFNDKTIINIGKNSNFSISEYLFDDNTEPIARFSLLKGAMQTITGKIGKIAPEKFTVKTKTAIIGIRGTIFSVLASEDGSTEIYCTSGALIVKVDDILITVPEGFYIIVSSTKQVSNLMKINQVNSDISELMDAAKDAAIDAVNNALDVASDIELDIH